MKRIISLLLVLLTAVSCIAFSACGNDADGKTTETSEKDFEIALVTDIGQLNDGSFNQGTWDGVSAFAEANGKTYTYYQPANGGSATDQDRIDSFNLAIRNGAKIIICPGFAFASALAVVAPANPDVKFVYIDGYTNGNQNLTAVAFREEQCGYMAGYAAVMDGYTKLGGTFGGNSAYDACNRFAFGYLQGINDAAKIKNIQADVRISHKFGTAFQPSDELYEQISGWYQAGTEVVFCCGGAMYRSVFAAAEANHAKSIGVDVDQSALSETVITSAMKGLAESVRIVLTDYYAGNWDSKLADRQMNFGADEHAVGLPTDTWSMTKFTIAEYEEILQKIVDGSIEISDEADWDAILLSAKKLSNLNFVYE